MPHRPRLLCLATPGQAREELERLRLEGPVPADLIAALRDSAVKVYSVSPEVAFDLQSEILGVGGRALLSATIRKDRDCAGEVILLASRRQLRLLEARLQKKPAALAVLADVCSMLDRLLRPVSFLAGRTRRLDLHRPRVMGILNVTPDSFSDGGCFLSPESALKQARRMVDEGADLIDVGGESTRPGAPPVAEAEELKRVLPVIRLLAAKLPVPLSIDTTKSAVAREAMAAGAEFINDISGLQFDREMPRVAAESGAGLFLMHTRGRSDQMQTDTVYDDLVGEVCAFLGDAMEAALAAGVARDRIALDPGIGFGKSAEGNLEILGRLQEFLALGRPLLLGTSRKSFLGKILNQAGPDERLYGTLATVVLGAAAGASIFRVHDVRPAREAALTAHAIRPFSTFR